MKGKFQNKNSNNEKSQDSQYSRTEYLWDGMNTEIIKPRFILPEKIEDVIIIS